MGRLATLLTLLALIVPPAPGWAAARGQGRRPAAATAPRKAKAGLAAATAAMKSLMRDRDRRQYRHHWERAISGLLAAARGRDAAAAWLEAGRARYALYRWSANESDRDKALLLANRAARAGSAEGKALAAAIRREAGDDAPEVARAQRPGRPARGGGAARAADPVERPPEPREEDSPADPTLVAALADLAAPGDPPALRLGEDGERGPAAVSEVRSWAGGDYSRVAIYLSHWVGWQKIELAAEGGQPRRLAFDFRPATLSGKALSRALSGAQIDRVRAAQNNGDTVRVVLDLAGGDKAQVFALDDPPRLVVDVGEHAAPAPPVAGAPARGDGPAASPSDEVEEAGPRTVRRIFVDAGHGGHDPGAIGRRGLREKDVTLDIARKVAGELKRDGFDVVLTRAGDRFLHLEERTALANAARADLFVSIHANANPRRSRSGIETYFLDVTHDRYAARLAARENGIEPGTEGEEGKDLRRILTDLDAKASAGSSRQLASLVQREVCRAVRTRFGEVRDLGVKSALFYVLLGARMPAVLVETGFISNAAEEKRLASAAYRSDVARAVSRAVREFARGDERVAAAR